MKKFSPREQKTLALVIGLGLVTLWMYFSFIVSPLIREIGDLGRQVRDAREQLKVVRVSTANETTLRDQQRQLQEGVGSMQQLLPSEEELPAVIESLSDLAGQSQVKIQTIFPQRPGSDGGRKDKDKGPVGEPKQPEIYKEVMIQIDALAGFHQLGSFLSQVEQAEKPMRVAGLRITQDPKETKRQRVKLLLQSYFTTGPGSETAAHEGGE